MAVALGARLPRRAPGRSHGLPAGLLQPLRLSIASVGARSYSGRGGCATEPASHLQAAHARPVLRASRATVPRAAAAAAEGASPGAEARLSTAKLSEVAQGVVPIVSFEALQAGDPAEGRRLFDALHNVGFLYLDDSPVAPALQDDIMWASREFFELPLEDKLAISISRERHFRGYGRLGDEVTDGIPDAKETLDLGPERASVDWRGLGLPAFHVLEGGNPWPPALGESWRARVLAFYEAVASTGVALMAHITDSVPGLDSSDALGLFPTRDSHAAILRMLCYAPAPEGTIGVGAHVDQGFLALLLQDHTGGLEVKSEGEWVPVPPREGSLVVNIGTMMQVWTRGVFKATEHRVINRSGTRPRYSVPFFLDPALDTLIQPLPPDKLAAAPTAPRGAPAASAAAPATPADPPLNAPDTAELLDQIGEGVVYGDTMLKVYERSFPQ